MHRAWDSRSWAAHPCGEQGRGRCLLVFPPRNIKPAPRPHQVRAARHRPRNERRPLCSSHSGLPPGGRPSTSAPPSSCWLAGHAGRGRRVRLRQARPAQPPARHLASGTGFKVPPAVTLKNALNPACSPMPAIGKVALHCNPVAKTLPTGKIFPITNPAAHLAVLWPSPPRRSPRRPQPGRHQPVRHRRRDHQPARYPLCLPSWRTLTGPPHRDARAAAGPRPLHLLPGEDQPGRLQPAPCAAGIEFTSKPVSARVSAVPAELCMPTEKIVAGTTFPIIHPAGSLLCFPVTATPPPPGRIRPEPVRHRQAGHKAHTLGASLPHVAH